MNVGREGHLLVHDDTLAVTGTSYFKYFQIVGVYEEVTVLEALAEIVCKQGEQ